MNMQRHHLAPLVGALALVFGVAAVATAQVPPPPSQPMPPQAPMQPLPPQAPMQPMPPQAPMQSPPPQADSSPPGAAQFVPGTTSQTSFPLPDSNGGTLTVRSGMPAQVQNYGPPPSFQSLDSNHDGRISHAEATAYPPLDSDFLFASGEGPSISAAQYEHWVKTQH